MTVAITLIPEKGWTVMHLDKSADNLSYDEMLGLVVAITMPETRPCLQWLQTKEQKQAIADYTNSITQNQKG